MTTITATDFGTNIGTWINRLAAGEKIIVRSRKHGDLQLSAKLIKPKPDVRTKPKRDIYAEFRGALQDWKDSLAGDKTKMHPIEELLHELHN